MTRGFVGPIFGGIWRASKFCSIFKISPDFQNFARFSKFCPIFKISPYFQIPPDFQNFYPPDTTRWCSWRQPLHQSRFCLELWRMLTAAFNWRAWCWSKRTGWSVTGSKLGAGSTCWCIPNWDCCSIPWWGCCSLPLWGCCSISCCKLMMMMTICFNEATRLLERSRSRWQEEEQMSPISSQSGKRKYF